MIPRLLQYFGSKHNLHKKGTYPKPVHRTVIEPFAGGASYSLFYEPKQVILIEKDPDIVACWKWLIEEATQSDVLALPCDELVVGQDIRELDLPYGAKVLIRLWQRTGRNTDWAVSSWVHKLWTARIRSRIAESTHKIKHWQIIEGDYTQSPDISATWFIDPPYQIEGRGYKFGSAAIDFEKLGDWCRTRKGISIVCENIGAKWLPFRPCGVVSGSRKVNGASKRSGEVVWIGGSDREF